jgi:hypothetical protein
VEDSDSLAGERGGRESRGFGRRSLGKIAGITEIAQRESLGQKGRLWNGTVGTVPSGGEERATRSERLRDGRGSPYAPGEGSGSSERALLRRCPPSRLTAAPVSIDPHVLVSGDETVFEGS